MNGITTDSKTFYIRLYHRKWMRQRGPQIGAPFKDQPYVKMLLTFNYTMCPLLTSFTLPTVYLLATLLCSLLRHTPCAYFTLLVVGAHPLLTITSLCLQCWPLRNEGTIAMTIILKNALVPSYYQIAPRMCDFKQSHKYAFLRANVATFLCLGASIR